MTRRPLSGIRVLELGQVAAAPFCGMLLADLGADVVKVERPPLGDPMRQWPPLTTPDDETPPFSENFASLNRNKRSITCDFGHPADLARLKELCMEADVLVENFRPGVLDRFGLGHADLRAASSRLVYCSITGYGQDGPYARRGAFDVTIQAVSGLMSVTGEAGRPPVKAGVPVADFATGLYAAYTIVAALRTVEREGVGAFIDCSMLAATLATAALQTSEYFGTNIDPKSLGSAHPRNAPYQAFAASDAPFVLAAGNQKLWECVCEVVDRPDLSVDQRFATQPDRARNQVELAAILQEIFSQRPATDWLTALEERGVPCAPVNTYSQILADEHVRHMELVEPLELPNGVVTRTVGWPVRIDSERFPLRTGPPSTGAHNDEVADEWLAREREPAAVDD